MLPLARLRCLRQKLGNHRITKMTPKPRMDLSKTCWQDAHVSRKILRPSALHMEYVSYVKPEASNASKDMFKIKKTSEALWSFFFCWCLPLVLHLHAAHAAPRQICSGITVAHEKWLGTSAAAVRRTAPPRLRRAVKRAKMREWDGGERNYILKNI